MAFALQTLGFGVIQMSAILGAAGHGTLHKYIIHNLQYTRIHSCKDGAHKPTDTGTDRCECV